MKKILNKVNCKNLMCTGKTVLGLLVALSVIYSFACVPMMAHKAKKDCHANALAAANEIVTQVQAANANLAEGEQPAQVNDVAVYDTQYSICLRSKGV